MLIQTYITFGVVLVSGNILLTPHSLWAEEGTQLLQAQTIESKRVLLKDLVNEAISKRPVLQAARHEIDSKEAQISPKGAYENPMLGLSAMNYPIDTLSPGEFGMTGNEFSLTQKIPFPGKLSKLSSAAEYEYLGKKAEYSNKELQLIMEVKLAYYALFVAYKRRNLLNEQLSVIRTLITVMRSKYTLGRAPQAELLSLQVEEANLMDQVLTADKQIAVKTGDLNHAVGRRTHHEIGQPEELKKTPINLSKLTEQAIGKKILAKNPGLKAMQSGFDAADSKLSYAKWNYLPDFEFRGTYTRRQPSPGDRGIDFVSGGVALSIPLWAITKESEEVKSARAEKSKAEALVDEERIHMLHMVHTSYSELEEAQGRLKLIEGGLLPLVRQAVQSGKSAYLTGKMEYSTVLNLIRQRFQTEVSYNEALANYESKIAEFEALLGEPLEDQ